MSEMNLPQPGPVPPQNIFEEDDYDKICEDLINGKMGSIEELDKYVYGNGSSDQNNNQPSEAPQNDHEAIWIQTHGNQSMPCPSPENPFAQNVSSPPPQRPEEPQIPEWGEQLRCNFLKSKHFQETDVQIDFRRNRPVQLKLGRNPYAAMFLGLAHSNVEFSKVPIDGTSDIGCKRAFQVSRSSNHLVQTITISNQFSGIVHGLLIENDGEENIVTVTFLMESQSNTAPGGRRETFRQWKVFCAPITNELLEQVDNSINFVELPNESIKRRWEAPIQIFAESRAPNRLAKKKRQHNTTDLWPSLDDEVDPQAKKTKFAIISMIDEIKDPQKLEKIKNLIIDSMQR